MRPKFSSSEEFLIKYYLDEHQRQRTAAWVTDLVTTLIGLGIVTWGLKTGSSMWIMAGFAVPAFRLLRGAFSSNKYNRQLAAIIDKYESSHAGDDRNTAKRSEALAE